MRFSFLQPFALATIAFSSAFSPLFAYDRMQLHVIQQGVTVWNSQRQTTVGETLDLSRAPLAKAQLAGADLADVSLSSAFLKEANLHHAHLQRANLRWSVLDGADLREALLVGAHLFEASCVKANLRGANFSRATSFEQADVTGAVVSNNTILPSGQRVDERWALRHNATFVEEVERPIPLLPKDVPSIQPPSTQPSVGSAPVASSPSANVAASNAPKAASLSHNEGKQYARATLNGLNWSNANLANANFYKAEMKGIVLQDANLQSANLDRAFLLQANLQRANLAHAVLFGATLENADLRNANLAGASLFGVNCERADLRGTILTGATLTDAVFTNALISSTTVLPSGKAATRQWAVMQQAIFSQE